MIITRKLCMTKDVGVNGNLFGGNMLAWIDEAAAIFAHLQTREERMVTLRFGEVTFHEPIKVGYMLDFYCTDVIFGKTSITFKVNVYLSETQTMVCSTSCTFVAVDKDGHKKLIEK